MEIQTNFLSLLDFYVGRQIAVQSGSDSRSRDGTRGKKIDNLPLRMDPRIRSSGRSYLYPVLKESMKAVFHQLLNGGMSGLSLPSIIRRTVILQDNFYITHSSANLAILILHKFYFTHQGIIALSLPEPGNLRISPFVFAITRSYYFKEFTGSFPIPNNF